MAKAIAKRRSVYLTTRLYERIRRVLTEINRRNRTTGGGYSVVSENALLTGMLRNQTAIEEVRMGLPAMPDEKAGPLAGVLR